MYINSGILNTDKLIELQREMTCPNNPMSTYVHELIHWKDAQKYKKYNTLDNQGEYLKSLRKQSKKDLINWKSKGMIFLVLVNMQRECILGKNMMKRGRSIEH